MAELIGKAESDLDVDAEEIAPELGEKIADAIMPTKGQLKKRLLEADREWRRCRAHWAKLELKSKSGGVVVESDPAEQARREMMRVQRYRDGIQALIKEPGQQGIEAGRSKAGKNRGDREKADKLPRTAEIQAKYRDLVRDYPERKQKWYAKKLLGDFAGRTGFGISNINQAISTLDLQSL